MNAALVIHFDLGLRTGSKLDCARMKGETCELVILLTKPASVLHLPPTLQYLPLTLCLSSSVCYLSSQSRRWWVGVDACLVWALDCLGPLPHCWLCLTPYLFHQLKSLVYLLWEWHHPIECRHYCTKDK